MLSVSEYTGRDPAGFVVSLNLHRRHLSESQRAMVAARLATLGEGRPSGGTASIDAVSQDKAAELLNVGKRSVERGANQHASVEAPIQDDDQAENVMCKAVPRLRPALDFTGAGAPDRARIDERVRGGIDLPARH